MKRKLSLVIAFVVTLLIGIGSTFGQSDARPDCEILATGSGRVVRLAPDFSVLWEYPAGNVNDVKLLPNGNVLFADNGVVEVTPEKKVVFRFTPPKGTEGTFTCQRLPNGNTLIGENETGKIIELDPDGKEVFSLQTQFKTTNRHHRLRYVRKLENGNYLTCQSGDHLVREYTPSGEIVWEQAVPNIAFAAMRLENGHTMISSLDQITEYAPDGKIVWELKKSDLPELAIRNMTGFFIRKNGNIAVGCYDAYHADGSGVGMFEVTRDKKPVWFYSKPVDGRKVDRSMMGIQMLESK